MSIERDRDRHIPGTQVSPRLVRLPDSQTEGSIALSSQGRVRVRGPQVLSIREILVRGDLQYRGVASVANYIPDGVVRVRMLVMLAGKLVT